MRQSIAGVLGLAAGAIIGSTLGGGPLVMTIAVGLGGLLGFYLGTFIPAPAPRKP